MVFLSAVLVCFTELADCLAAKKIQSESFNSAIKTQNKKAKKAGQKLLDVTKLTLTSKREAYQDGELIVKYKKSKKPELKVLSVRDGSFDKKKMIDDKLTLFSSEEKIDVVKETKKMRSRPDVEYVQPNFQYVESQINANDPMREKMWGLENTGQEVNGKRGTNDADIDAPEAWEASGGGEDVLVAVIDTGVAFGHPDIAANMWDGANCVDWNGNALGGCQYGYDFAADDKNPLPDASAHGTMVAGVIGAARANAKGVIGVADNVKIMALKTDFTTDEIVKAIAFAEKNGAKIINASWGASVTSCKNLFDRSLYEAVKNFPGLVVAAAGNNGREHDGKTNFFYPADFSRSTDCWSGLSNVVSVAATNQEDKLASFSDFGKMVDIGAPGENIASTYATFGMPGTDQDGSDERYALSSGTSLAAPYVSGTAALRLAKSQRMSPAELKNEILDSSDVLADLAEKIPQGRRVNALQSFARKNVEKSQQDQSESTGGTVAALGDLHILGESPEISTAILAQIRIENPEAAGYFRLLKNKKKLKKAKWKPMPDILVRLAKNKKKQKFYLQFKDEAGHLSPVYGKTFLYRKS